VDKLMTNPIAWSIAGLIVAPLASRLWLKLEAFVVGWLTARGNAPAADLAALIGDAGQGILTAVAAGKSPQDALAHAKAAVLAAYAADKGRALKDVEAELGLLVEGKLRLHANLAPVVAAAPGGAAVNIPAVAGFAVPRILAILCGLSLLGLLSFRLWTVGRRELAAIVGVFVLGVLAALFADARARRPWIPRPPGLRAFALLLGLALALPARAQAAAPSTPSSASAPAATSGGATGCPSGQVADKYTGACEAPFVEGQFSHGPMLSGFLFRLQDPATHAPADYSFGAGVGYSVDWDFLPEDFGPTIGWQKPLLSLGFGALGVGTEDDNQLLLSLGAGPEICLVDHLACVLFVPDLAQVFGSQVTGILVGKVGASNIATALTVGFQFGGSGQLSTR
jgi:hypothetical protein